MSRLDHHFTIPVWDRPFAQAEPRTVHLPEGLSLAAMTEQAVSDPVLRNHLVIALNGRRVPASCWARVRPKRGAHLTFAVRPAGGDDGSKVLRTILQVAVIAVATWVGGGAGGAISSKLWAAAAAATVTVAGNLAINALVPPPQPSLEGDRFAPTYSIEGARNTAEPYGPVQLLLGKRRFFPKLQALPLQESVGDDVYLRLLFSLGPMPLSYEAASLKIGETPVTAFDDVEWEMRLTEADAPITLFANDPFTEAVGAHLTPAAGWVTRVTQTDVTEIAAVLAFPQGLGAKNSKGKNVSASVTVEMEYQHVDDHPVNDPWYDARPTTPQANAGADSLGFTRANPGGLIGGLLADLQDEYNAQTGVGGGSITFTRAEAGKPFRRELRAAVPKGQYRVRVRRQNAEAGDDRTADRVEFAQLISISPRNPSPEPKHALLAMRIKASDQLSGVVDTVNLTASRMAPVLDPAIFDAPDPDLYGVALSDWSGAAETRNPADLALFVLQGPMTARPAPDSRINAASLAAFARHCKANGYTFDEVIDRPMSRGDLLRLICSAGRARPVTVNGQYHFVIDAPSAAPARQVFTARNVRGFRVSRTFPDDVHALRCAFPNEAEDYRLDERTVYFEGYSKDGSEAGTVAASRIERLELPGQVNADRVFEELWFHGATAQLQSERYTFSCDLEGLTCKLGDDVRVSHDVLVVGRGSGKIRSLILDGNGDISGAVLDRKVERLAGETPGLVWRRVIDNGDGTARIEVSASRRLVSGAAYDATVYFDQPMDPGDPASPEADDLFAFGPFEEETLLAVVKKLRPGPDLSCDIELMDKALARFEAGSGVIPDFQTGLVTPPVRRPPTPELTAVNVNEDGIYIGFAVPSGYEARVQSIEAAWRETAAPGEENAWTPLPALASEDRALRFNPPDPDSTYDFRLAFVDIAGRRSDPPLIAGAIAADGTLAEPQGVTAVAATLASANGVRQPALQVAATANADLRLTDLLVEIRPSASVDPADFKPLAVLPPDRPARDIRDVPPGATVDVGFRYRARRGEREVYSDYAIVEDVAIPDELGATQLGGDAAAVWDQLIADAQAAADDAQEAADAAQDDADAISADLDAFIAGLTPGVVDAAAAGAQVRSDIAEGRRRSSRLAAEVAASLSLLVAGQAQATDADALRAYEITQLGVRADGIEATATQALDATVDLEANKASLAAFTDLQGLVGTDDGEGDLVSRAGALEALVVSLELDKAEVGRVEDLEIQLGSDDGQGPITGRLQAVEVVTADLVTGKVDVTDFNLAEARLSDVEDQADAADQAISDVVASVETLDQATAERDRAAAQRLSRTLAEIIAGQAQASQGVSAVADGLKLEAKRVFDLGVRATDAEARLSSSEQAIIDLENDKAETSALNTATSRITANEDAIALIEAEFEPGGAIPVLQASLSSLETTKADAADLTAQTERIDDAFVLIGTDDGQGALFGRIGGAETAIADLESGKVDVSTYNVLVGRVDTVEDDVDAAQSAADDAQTDATTALGQIETLDQVTAERDRVQAQRLSRTLAELAFGQAQAVQGVSAVADGLKLEAKRVFDLQVESEDLGARVTQAEEAVIDLDNNKAEASRVSTLEALVGTDDGEGPLVARMVSVEDATVDLENGKASAQSVSDLAIRVGDAEGNISTLSEAVGDIEGNLLLTHGFTLDANGHIGGMAALNDGTTVSIVFAADVFEIATASGSKVPFSVSGDTVSMTNVEIDGALIKEATIDTLNLVNGSVTDVKTATIPVVTTYYQNSPNTSVAKRNTANHRTIEISIDYDNVVPGSHATLLVNLVQEARLGMADWVAFEIEIVRISRTDAGAWSAAETVLFETTWLRELRSVAYPTTMYNAGAPIDVPYSFNVEDEVPAFQTGDAYVSPAAHPEYRYLARTKISYQYDTYSNFDGGHDNAQNNSNEAKAKTFTLTGIMAKR